MGPYPGTFTQPSLYLTSDPNATSTLLVRFRQGTKVLTSPPCAPNEHPDVTHHQHPLNITQVMFADRDTWMFKRTVNNTRNQSLRRGIKHRHRSNCHVWWMVKAKPYDINIKTKGPTLTLFGFTHRDTQYYDQRHVGIVT